MVNEPLWHSIFNYLLFPNDKIYSRKHIPIKHAEIWIWYTAKDVYMTAQNWLNYLRNVGTQVLNKNVWKQKTGRKQRLRFTKFMKVSDAMKRKIEQNKQLNKR